MVIEFPLLIVKSATVDAYYCGQWDQSDHRPDNLHKKSFFIYCFSLLSPPFLRKEFLLVNFGFGLFRA